MYCTVNIAWLLPLYIQVILEHEQGRALLADSLYHVNNPFYVAAKMGRTEVLEVHVSISEAPHVTVSELHLTEAFNIWSAKGLHSIIL